VNKSSIFINLKNLNKNININTVPRNGTSTVAIPYGLVHEYKTFLFDFDHCGRVISSNL